MNRKDYFGSHFWKFWPMVYWFCQFRLVMTHHYRHAWRNKPFHFMVVSKQKKKVPLKSMSPMTWNLFLDGFQYIWYCFSYPLCLFPSLFFFNVWDSFVNRIHIGFVWPHCASLLKTRLQAFIIITGIPLSPHLSSFFWRWEIFSWSWKKWMHTFLIKQTWALPTTKHCDFELVNCCESHDLYLPDRNANCCPADLCEDQILA